MIETARLLLRPMRIEDVDGLLGVFGDPVVMAAFGVGPFMRSDMERWVRRNLDHQDRHGYGLFAVVHRGDGRLVGDCGLEHMDDGSGDVELGYDLRSDYWGRGLATEAAAAVRDHAFGLLGVERLIGLIRCGNERSRRVAEKIGMRRSADVSRSGRDYWRYTLSREEYDAGSLPAQGQERAAGLR